MKCDSRDHYYHHLNFATWSEVKSLRQSQDPCRGRTKQVLVYSVEQIMKADHPKHRCVCFASLVN